MLDRIFLNNPQGDANWIGLLQGGVDVANGIAFDSSGNTYVCGTSNSSGWDNLQIAKYNSSGAIQWQRQLGNGSGSNEGRGVAVDASSNVYICGTANVGGVVSIVLAKYNSSGTIQWQRRLYTGNGDAGYAIATDSSGNVYVCGMDNTSSYGSFIIAKYDTSGTIQWQRKLAGGSSNYEVANGIGVDGSGNVYVVGYGPDGTRGSNVFLLAKYNSSGTLQWQRWHGGATGTAIGYGIAVDSSGNSYICGYSSAGGYYSLEIAKYSTSGSLQNARVLTDNVTFLGYARAYGVALDGLGNVYVCGHAAIGSGGTQDCVIAKYDTSLTLQWQRKLGGSTDDFAYGIAADGQGNVYVCGKTAASGNDDFLLAKLPGNGTMTGTYSVGGYSFTYAASSLTDSSSSLSQSTSTLTSSTSTLTDASTSLTDAASSLTSSVVTL